MVVRDTTYGLSGLTITVHGDGQAELRKQGWGSEPGYDATVQLDADSTAGVFDAFVEHAFTEMVIAPHAGIPDELHFTLRLSGAGGTHTLAKFASAEHARFMRLLETVAQIVRRRLDREAARRLTL